MRFGRFFVLLVVYLMLVAGSCEGTPTMEAEAEAEGDRLAAQIADAEAAADAEAEADLTAYLDAADAEDAADAAAAADLAAVDAEAETDTGSDTPPTTEAPEQVRLPEHLAISCGILGFEDLGGGEYTVTLNGDCQTAVEGFYDFAATVEVTDAQWGTSPDSGIRVLLRFRVLNGEVIISANEFDQSKAVGGSIDGVSIPGDAEWTASNQITFTAPDTALLDSEVSVLVWVREAEESEQLNERYP